MKTILALDPGSKNCGYAVTRYKGPKSLKLSRHDPQKSEILEAGLILNTIQSMVSPHFEADYSGFIIEIERIINTYSPDEVYLERYQTRGFKGTTIEAVNIMIGIVSALFAAKGIPVRLVIAGQWKSQFNRSKVIELNRLYKRAHNSFRCPPHVIDAICINLYGNSFFDRKHAYKDFPINLIGKYLKTRDWREIQKDLNKQYAQRTKGR